MNIQDYINEFKEIKKDIKSNPVAIAILQEHGKDRRQAIANSSPASEKQKKFMSDLGIKYSKGVTKIEAPWMIDKKKKEAKI